MIQNKSVTQDNIMIAAPHVAKSGSGRLLAKLPRYIGRKGLRVRLDGQIVELRRIVDRAASDEVWSTTPELMVRHEAQIKVGAR